MTTNQKERGKRTVITCAMSNPESKKTEAALCSRKGDPLTDDPGASPDLASPSKELS